MYIVKVIATVGAEAKRLADLLRAACSISAQNKYLYETHVVASQNVNKLLFHLNAT